MQPPSSKLWNNFSNSILLRFLLLFACGWSIVILINYFYNTIALFAIAGIFATLLNYPVVWLSLYLPRGVAIATTFIVAVALVIGIILIIGIEVINQGQGLLNELQDTLNEENFLPFQNFLEKLEIDKIISTLQTGLASGLTIVQTIFSSVFKVIFGAVITVYMLIDGNKLWQSFLKLIPLSSRDRFKQTFIQSFLGFLRGQLLLMIFLSISTFIIFSLFGVPYALILSIIIGILDAIPGIGATLGIVVVTLLVFTSEGGTMALTVVIISVLLQQIQDNIIHPKVMSNALQLDPVLLFLALFIGERIAGLLGVFLAIPIAGMIGAWMRSFKVEESILLEETSENINN
ncbi:hypothetical protein GM3708_270 [Geminocystis sp. NIES-3708]|uniref:AI-2E family transporter n=1 Tax=Geminocystis sp. NIES-3708 TaxID=1615909 RepID=UPI0005FC5D6C|nr:AI-2E family transporter [Geminocystis sp. NIES-3708]BAQ59864.1 hypothetical protein GM3708_270 [Geminocystis sp. NIES-3708]